MKWVVFVACLAFAAANTIKDDDTLVTVTKETLVNVDIKVKEKLIMKLFNHILQPTVYDDIREVAREWVIQENMDKYLKVDVVKKFIETFRLGMLPRGEVFVHTNKVHMEQAVRVFRLLYFSKDFDVMFRTACWLRERINGGMFVYALTATIFHRDDCRGIILPAPYEIYPYYFVDSKVINKAMLSKMTKCEMDPVLTDYWGIRKIMEKNMCIIESRKGVRHALTKDDRLVYFTEDIDLNTYMYYLHMDYPFWMNDDVYGLNKERRGEVTMYAYQQLLARLRLERLAHEMCDIKMLSWTDTKVKGYWPKIRMHNGEEMPVRMMDKTLITKENIKEKLLLDDLEKFIRDGIFKGKFELRDGTVLTIRKAEDIEILCRMILGHLSLQHDDAKMINMMNLFKRILGYNMYNVDKYTYVPTALDMYTTVLRDPIFWKVMKRVTEHVVLFKNLLPKYTKTEFDFPGVKVEKIVVDKMVTFMDEYDMDITNALMLDTVEMKKKHSDMIFINRVRRMNHLPFKINIEIMSDKAVDSVVRVFLGPKYDCMGRLMDVNDKRLDMVEIDSFMYKLETGKNVIVRDSRDLHNIVDDRIMTRKIWDKMWHMDTTTNTMMNDHVMVDKWWYKSRVGFPKRLLLPMGRKGGMPMQLYVIVTPVRNGLLLPTIDMTTMKERRACRWTICFDTMPLGFPFDREIDMTHFFTMNMKFVDVKIWRKEMETMNVSKDVDMSNMIMKVDDLTYLDKDMLVRRSYRETMMMSADRQSRM